MKLFSSFVVLVACCYQIFEVDGYKCLPSGLNIPCRNLDESYCQSLCPQGPELTAFHTCPGTNPLLSCGHRNLKDCRLWCDSLKYMTLPGAKKPTTTTEAPKTFEDYLRRRTTPTPIVKYFRR